MHILSQFKDLKKKKSYQEKDTHGQMASPVISTKYLKKNTNSSQNLLKSAREGTSQAIT